MPNLRLLRAGLVAAALASGALAAGGGDSQSPPVSLAFDVQPILDTYCVQCHLLESAQGELVLESGEAWANLVKIDSTQAPLKRVEPGTPQASYLLHKLRGTHIQAGGSGQIMPYGSEASSGIPARDVELIERWINDGAADN